MRACVCEGGGGVIRSSIIMGTRGFTVSQCLLFSGGMVGVGVLVEGRKQRLQGGLGCGGGGLLQGTEVYGGVGRGRAVARVGRASAEGGGGRGRKARQAGGGVEEGLVVEEECTLVDEGLDDCLVGASGGQGIHSGEVWPHEGGPETDGKVFTGHQVQPAQLTHPALTTGTEEHQPYARTPSPGDPPKHAAIQRTHLCKWLSTYLKTS